MGTTEDLFEGTPGGLPDAVARGRALYRQAEGPTAAVRHVGGYARFIEFCDRNGVRASELASDPERLIWFLRTHGSQLAGDGALSAAAAVFAGNTIAGLRPDARWTAYEGASPTVGNAVRQFEVDRLLGGLRSADDESVQGLVAMLADWAQEELDEAPAAQPIPVAPPAGQTRYVRPHLPTTVYYSPEGEPIPFGRQWGDDGPDPDSYSVDSHPERFAGLHAVARALIDHLRDVYDVDVDEDPVHAGEMLLDVKDVLESVKVTPRRSGAAPLTFVLTGYPGVAVHAGVLHDFPFPVCGCDACDETVGQRPTGWSSWYFRSPPADPRTLSGRPQTVERIRLERVRRFRLGKRPRRTRPGGRRPPSRRRGPAAGSNWGMESWPLRGR